ncbi:MAG: hypothetical protein NC093_02460 [Alistipes sp.]|nr:hypothetical protein [Alistipes sp.]
MQKYILNNPNRATLGVALSMTTGIRIDLHEAGLRCEGTLRITGAFLYRINAEPLRAFLAGAENKIYGAFSGQFLSNNDPESCNFSLNSKFYEISAKYFSKEDNTLDFDCHY